MAARAGAYSDTPDEVVPKTPSFLPLQVEQIQRRQSTCTRVRETTVFGKRFGRANVRQKLVVITTNGALWANVREGLNSPKACGGAKASAPTP